VASNKLLNLQTKLRAELPELRARFGVTQLSLFGSYVRGEQRRDSDLDVLAAFAKPPSLVQLMQLEQHLSAVTHLRVDLVMKQGLRKRVGEKISSELLSV
jgi:uncharacterized protein